MQPSPPFRFLRTLLGCGLALGASHCNDVDTTVFPGETIQAAIDRMPAMADKWVVEVMPGVYNETLDVTRGGVELRGHTRGIGSGPENRPVLDGTMAGGKLLKDGMVVSGSHFTVSGFTVRNYAGNGITSQKTDHTTFRDVITDKAGKYGLYPVESQDILIENCTSTNTADAGIYVGQSQRATVRGCIVHDNVAGIEIENTVDALVERNEAYNNTAGILVFLLPGGASKVAASCTVQDNYSHDNNHPNFGDKTSTVAKVPPGMGMLVMAADDTTFTGNTIVNNGSAGLSVLSLAQLLPNPAALDIEPLPDRTRIVNNTYQGNGKMPSKEFLDVAAPNGIMNGGDLVFDGTGTGNCQDEPQINQLVSVGIPLNRCQ